MCAKLSRFKTQGSNEDDMENDMYVMIKNGLNFSDDDYGDDDDDVKKKETIVFSV